MIYHEIQQECKRAGLGATGSTNVLVQQLLGDSEPTIKGVARGELIIYDIKVWSTNSQLICVFSLQKKLLNNPPSHGRQSQAKIQLRKMLALSLKHLCWTMNPREVWTRDKQFKQHDKKNFSSNL
jgi:hypothetical protein